MALRVAPHAVSGLLTCQSPLPDILPEEIPRFGCGAPQLLAERAPEPQLSRASSRCHRRASTRS